VHAARLHVVVDSPWGVGEAVLGRSIPDRRMPLRTPPGYARNPLVQQADDLGAVQHVLQL
jgi:hypothetical protein